MMLQLHSTRDHTSIGIKFQVGLFVLLATGIAVIRPMLQAITTNPNTHAARTLHKP